jgi:hypothetical protein
LSRANDHATACSDDGRSTLKYGEIRGGLTLRLIKQFDQIDRACKCAAMRETSLPTLALRHAGEKRLMQNVSIALRSSRGRARLAAPCRALPERPARRFF